MLNLGEDEEIQNCFVLDEQFELKEEDIILMQVDKYDRQIRLWGAEGQRRLGEAAVALLGCSGPGIETLKNLILPGVGVIDIWDDRTITKDDLSSSFFYAHEDVGKPRAEAASANLLEMNPDVKGSAIVAKPCSILNDRLKLRSYNLIIASDLVLSEQSAISKVCWQQGVTVVFIAVVGFYIYVRNQKRTHVIQFERTAAKKYYMRLDNPFPALQEHSKQWNIPELMDRLQNTKTEEEKKLILNKLEHIPYPIILMQLHQMLPQKQRTKDKMLEKIKDWSMMVGEGYRENFTQAGSRYFDLMQTPDNFLRDLDRFQSDFVKKADLKSQPGLIFLRICGQMLKKTGCLPQPTDLPDMQTETRLFIELKQVYKAQHQVDISTLEGIMMDLYGQVPLSRKKISEFINNLQALQVMDFDPYFKELQKIDNPMLEWLEAEWRHIMLALRAWQMFQDKHGRVAHLEDFEAVRVLAEGICSQFGFANLEQQRYVKEICRVNGQSTVNMFSIAGAVAGQQCIKLIARCFTPVKNGFIFSGVHQKGFSVSV